MKERDHFEDLGVEGRKILKLMFLRNRMGVAWNVFVSG